MKTTRKTASCHAQPTSARPRRPTSCLKSIMKTSVDAIAICEQDGRVIFSNPSFKRLFGYSSQEMNGLLIGDCLPFLTRDLREPDRKAAAAQTATGAACYAAEPAP